MSGSEVVWPPAEKVRFFGSLTRAQTIGCGLVLTMVVVGVNSGRMFTSLALSVPVLAWTFLSWKATPVRSLLAARLRWWTTAQRAWSAPLRGGQGTPRYLAGIRLHLADARTAAGPVGVVQSRGGSFTVVVPVEAASFAFLASDTQVQRFDAWGELLAGLCLEPGSAVAAARVAWTDVHRAADPAALVAYHARHGQPGPAADDYVDYVAGFGQVASSHEVLVAVTVTRDVLRAARSQGLAGSDVEVLCAAAVQAAREVASGLTSRGFTVGAMLSPAELGRLIVETGDPFAFRTPERSARERFGLPERTGPDRVDVARHEVAVDGAYHRAFLVTWPRTRVPVDWLWRPMAMPGPKLVTMVFEPVAPSAADRRRERLTTRSETNNTLAVARRGRLRTTDSRKTQALVAAERAVADGHQELDGYALVVLAARTVDELNAKSQDLRQRLRESGRAGVRELTGEHDLGLAAALPLGVAVRDRIE